MKSVKSKSSLSRRFSLSTIGVVTFILFLFSVSAILYSTMKINEKLQDRLENVSVIAVASLQSALWNLERDTIKDIIDALFQEEEVVYFRLSDETGVYYENKAPEFNNRNFPFFQKSPQFVTKVLEINFKGKQIGTIELSISKKSYKQELQVSIISIIALAVVILIAISLTSIFITRRHIFTPLQKLEDSAVMISKGKLETEIDTSGKDEIGTLAKAFDDMRQSLRNLFEKQDLLVEERTAALYKSQQKLKTIIDNLRRRIYWKDINGVIEGGNKALAKALKLSKPEDLKGMIEADIWKREEVVQLFQSLTQESMEKKEPKINVIEPIIDNSGVQRWVRIDCSPLEDEHSRVTGVLVTYRDITDEKQYEDELKKAKDEAERANKAKDQFLATVSHEVRTPMNSIIGFIDKVLNTKLTSDQRKSLEFVDSSAHDLLRIINDILYYSSIESGELKIIPSEFQLHSVLEDVKNSFNIHAKQKHISLFMDRKKGIPNSLVGDEVRLKQILKNLVSNAIRFTEEGEVRLTVSCDKKGEGKVLVRFAVRDTGIGIAQKDQGKIFLPYKQLSAVATRGVGLGLTICKQLVTLMGGELNVESELGKGSTFYFSILFSIQPEGEDSKSGIRNAKQIDLTNLKGLQVLLVEDDPSSQVLMKSFLSIAGIQVDCAESGIEAIQRVFSTSYDVVLMDLQLPGLDGYEAMRRIRRDKRFTRLPIIAVTASAIAGDVGKCLEAGANEVIFKPVSADKLLLTIKKWIHKGGKQ